MADNLLGTRLSERAMPSTHSDQLNAGGTLTDKEYAERRARSRRRRRAMGAGAAIGALIALYALGAFDVAIVSLTGQNLGLYDCYRIGPYCTGPLSTSKPPALLLALSDATEPATPTPPRSGETAADANRRQIWYLFNNQPELAWHELHPAQQSLVTKAAFVACVSSTPSLISPSLSDITVTSTVPATLVVPGADSGAVAATNVTVSVSLAGQGAPTTLTRAEVRVGNTWRWAFDQDFIDAYSRGECLTAEFRDATTRSGLYGRLDGSPADTCGLQRQGESVRQYVNRMKNPACGGPGVGN